MRIWAAVVRLLLAVAATTLILGASTSTANIPGTAGPWDQTLNPAFDYGVHDNDPPVAINGSTIGIPFAPGASITVSYVSGTVSGGPPAAPLVDANGWQAVPTNTYNGMNGKYPAFYMSPSPVVYYVELVGTFANNGVIVGTPFAVGDGPTKLMIPAGATELLLGVNDNLYKGGAPNAGSFTVTVSGALQTGTIWTHHWALDGNFHDSIGSWDLTVLHGTGSFVSGVIGQAFRNNAASSLTAYNNQTFADANGSASFACWVRYPSGAANGAACAFGSGIDNESSLIAYPNTGTHGIDVASPNTRYSFPGAVNWADGNWHLIVASYDGVKGAVTVWLDDVQLGTWLHTITFHQPGVPDPRGQTTLGDYFGVLEEGYNHAQAPSDAAADEIWFGQGPTSQFEVDGLWNNESGGSPSSQPALYVSQAPGNGGTGFVTRFDLTPQHQATPIATLNGFAQGIACGPDTKLYVALTGYGSGSPPRQIVRLNPDGTGQTVVLDFDTTPALASSGGPDGLSFGPDGSLYFNTILSHGNLQATGVWRLAPGSTTPTQVILPFTSAGASGTSTAFLTAPPFAGSLIAADVTDNKVIRVAPPFTSSQTATDFITGVPEPSGVAIDNAGNVYVSEGANPATNVVNKYGPDGTFLMSLPPVGGNLARMAFDAANNLYVGLVNPSGPSVMRIAPDGTATSFGDVTTSPANGVTVCPQGSQQAPPPFTFGGSGQISGNLFTNEPIDTATGNYYLSHTDFTVPAKGFGTAFTRSYNSLDQYDGPLGFGWTHSYNVFLTVSGGNVIVKEADGHKVTFTPTGAGNYTAATPGVFDLLRQNMNGSYTLTRKAQMQFNFTAAGNLVSIVDRNGNTETLSYNASENLISITDSSGRAFSLSNDASGRITSLSDPSGRTWQYAYDSNRNLTAVRDPPGGITQYAYDSNHRMISATDPRGVTFLQNTYDTAGRVATQTNARSFVTKLAYNTPSGGTTTVTDPLGNVTRHVYDSSLRGVEIIDSKGGIISYAYDVNNDRTSITNQNGNTTNFTYDAQGNATSITDPLGNQQLFTYDMKNNLLTATNPKGATTNLSYDANGNLIGIRDALGNNTSFAYAAGLLTTKTDARGNTTSYAYDTAGNLTKVTDPLGHVTNLGYDGIGRLLTTTDPNGHTSSVAYDALSRLVQTKDALGDTTQFGYDGIGNLLKITDANGTATAYAYDGTSNLATVTDAIGQVTGYGYDANNNRISFTNARRNATTYTYDPLNRLTQITDPLSFVTSYAYDAVGNALATTDAKGLTNQYSYDVLNRLIKGTFADGSSVSYTYDKDGNRTSMVDARGTTTYSYDGLDRLISVASPGGAVVQYAYDAASNRSSLIYPDARVVQYQYDGLNRLNQVTDWAGKPTGYSYDAAGNLTGFTYPNGAASAYSYDAANRLLQIVNQSAGHILSSFTYALDSVGNRMQMTSSAGGVTKYAYDALYRLTSWMPPSGQVTQYGYDPVGNRTSMVSSAGTTLYSYDTDDRLLSAGAASYTYDNNGNQITKTNGSTTINYAFDTLNRMIAVTGGGTNSHYQYDGDGNRVGQTNATGAYQYLNDTATALPVVLNETGPDGTIDYLYGLSLISETSANFQYFYQADGQVSTSSLTDSTGALKANYTYDPWGKLITPIDPLGSKNKYKFTGEALDPGTGLYFLRARYYDPLLGRFVSKDPRGETGLGNTGSNRYPYALDQPIDLIDPSGQTTQDTSTSGSMDMMALSFTSSLGNSQSTSQFAPPILGSQDLQPGQYVEKIACLVVCKFIRLGKDPSGTPYETTSWQIGLSFGWGEYRGYSAGRPKPSPGSSVSVSLPGVSASWNLSSGDLSVRTPFTEVGTQGGAPTSGFGLGFTIGVNASRVPIQPGRSTTETLSDQQLNVLLQQNDFHR